MKNDMHRHVPHALTLQMKITNDPAVSRAKRNHGHDHKPEVLSRTFKMRQRFYLLKRQDNQNEWYGFYLDYGNEEEVADCHVDIRESEKEDASNIKSESGGRRELFRESQDLGLNSWVENSI